MDASDGEGGRGTCRVRCSIAIDAGVEQVFSEWTRFESLPHCMEGVRRTKWIDERRILWDADVAGRQVVWEAEIVEFVPDERIGWESRWGADNAGEVVFDALPGARTLVTVDVTYRPRGLLERAGARLGLLDARIRRDLAEFRRFVQRRAAAEASA